MRLQIRTRDLDLTESIRTHVERRIEFALDRVAHRVSEVTVHLADVNGPRGGIDKHCGVLVRVTGGSPVVLREHDPCIYEAIDRATGRMKQLVKERLRRHRAQRRGHETIRRPLLDDLTQRSSTGEQDNGSPGLGPFVAAAPGARNAEYN